MVSSSSAGGRDTCHVVGDVASLRHVPRCIKSACDQDLDNIFTRKVPPTCCHPSLRLWSPDRNVKIEVVVFCLFSIGGKYCLIIINVIGIIFCHFSNPREYLPDPVQEKDRTPSNPETQLAQSSESFPTKTNSSCDSITNSNII